MQQNQPETRRDRDTLHHIGFLYHNLRPRDEDKYLVDMILALLHFGHKVTIFTSSTEPDNYLDVCAQAEELQICYSGWWLPDKILGRCSYVVGKFKAMWTAVQLLFIPKMERPKLIILDTDTIPLLIFHFFSNYKTLFIQHFNELLSLEKSNDIQQLPGMFTVKSLKYADQFLVQTKGLAKVFKKSFPEINKKICISYPCAETSLLSDDLIDIDKILPDYHPNEYLFCCFGDYSERSNFELVLSALRKCSETLDTELKPLIRLVIIGSTDKPAQKNHYCKLIDLVKHKPFANQITFLTNMTHAHKVSILQACTAMLQPIPNYCYPGLITLAMSLGKPVIATNSGFAQEVLVHRLSGILIDPEPEKFAQAMKTLMKSPLLREFIGNMAKQVFSGSFSFQIFADTLNNTINELLAKTWRGAIN